ncbi:MAG: hypothetical protein KatS3mg131_2116 [Candidatus Tectimicrobiota bacterium]|nr:MAG: hypothetical protein KatS3mg131_2116 [Candidatus Tectomicrobia bacterium]
MCASERRTLSLLAALAGAIVLALVPAAAAQKITWKMQSTWSAGDFHHQNPTFLVNAIKEMSGGRPQHRAVACWGGGGAL